MMLGPRVFMVVSLKADGAGYTGFISRPGQFTTDADGVSFSRFGTAVITEPITAAAPADRRLHAVAQDPDDAFDMTLQGPDEALLKWTIMPFEPWKFERSTAAEAPRVAADWDWAAVIDKQDAERRTQTRALLASGQLHTGEDFKLAAFIFQHGSIPEDHLLAHTLAMIAVAKGESDAIWIGTATLDRYLQSVDKAQIYGTQFKTPPGAPVTQEPYNRELISDALRRMLGVPSLEAQRTRLKYWQEQYDAAKKK